MTPPRPAANAPRGLPGVFRWAIVCAFLVGPLLTIVAGVLPEHAASAVTWLGLGLMLASIAGVLAYVARKTGLEWRGISPVFGILLGALPLLALDGWNDALRPHQAQAAPTPAKTALAARLPQLRPPPGVAAAALGSAAASQRPATQDPYGAPFPSGAEPPQGPFDELAAALNVQGRAAARAALLSAVASARPGDAQSMSSRIADAESALANFRASLDRVRAGNSSFSEEFDSALGDTAPIAELDAGLQQFASSAGGEDLQQAATRLRANTIKLNTWITACNQRLATVKAEVEGPSSN